MTVETATSKTPAESRSALIAHGALICAIFAWGSAFVATKYIIDDVPPMTLAFLRTGLAAVALTALAGSKMTRLRISRRNLALLLVLGALGVSYFYVASNIALQQITATTASLLLLPFPAVTALGAWLILREPLGMRRIVGIVLAASGALFLIVTTASDGAGGTWFGNLLVVSTTLTWAGYTIAGRVFFPRWPVEVTTAWIMLGGTIVLVPFAAIEYGLGDRPTISLLTALLIVYIAVFCTAAPYLLWSIGVERVEAARASIYSYLQPVFVALLAFSFLGEVPTILAVVGAVLVVIGTFIVARR